MALRKDIFGESTLKFTKKITSKTPLHPYLNRGDYSIPISEKWQEYVDFYANKKQQMRFRSNYLKHVKVWNIFQEIAI